MRVALHLSGLLLLLLQADKPAPPAIVPGGIVNAASLMPATLPAGALAPGARIRIPGIRLGPPSAIEAPAADAPAQLAGVTVLLTQSGRSFSLPVFLASERRIETMVAADAQPGPAQLTVSYRGMTSEPYPLNLARSSPGLFAPDTAIDAAPGGKITIRATGFSSAPEVYLAGRRIPSTFEPSLSCCRGLQSIAIVIPADTPMGCAVPLVARAAEGAVSNALALAIHASGVPCRDQVAWFRGALEHATRGGYVLLARIQLDAPLLPHYQVDYGLAGFSRQQPGQSPFPPLPPYGACTQLTERLNLRALLAESRNPSEWSSIPQEPPGIARLDAGKEISIAGPTGARTLKLDPRRPETYSAVVGGAAPFSHAPKLPDFLAPGRFTIVGGGGSDVGPFVARLSIPGVLQWKNRDALATVDRARGATVLWKAARRDSAILIVAANADNFSGDSAMSLCMAPARDGRFTIPPLALANLPPTTSTTEISASYLLLLEMPAAPPLAIKAAGLDAAFAAYVSAAAYAVIYQ